MTGKYKRELAAMLESDSLPEVTQDDTFTFGCVDVCMGRCCNTISIMLDPWDVETMARYLGLPGQEFLKEYCIYELDQRGGWPFVRLRHAETGACAFMLPGGKCRVYPARSRNCRTYPLGRAVRVDRDGGEARIEGKLFMVERQKFCLGHGAGRVWTVREWLAEAAAEKYDELSDLYIELIDYAGTGLAVDAWMTSGTAQLMAPLLFGADLLRKKVGVAPAEASHEEFYRRRLKALRALLTELAACFGFGPKAGAAGGEMVSSVTMMEQVKNILIAG